ALNQDESKYREYNYEERVRHNITSARDYTGAVGGLEKTSSSRSLDKHGQKDDGHLRSSPLQLVDKSPSSSTDRRQFGRPDVRRNIDVERIYTEGWWSSRLEGVFWQGRTGVDSHLLGSAEEDGRGKSNIRHRRIGDPNMGRIQANAWRGVPNWPSPMANGFLPFPHAPPVGFHSVMQPFPAPPMFGVRPSMELNHPGPYHIPDADRFSGPGRPMDGIIRNMPRGRGWETSSDLFKGQNRSASMEMLSSEKENNSTRSGDEALTTQSIPPAQSEQTLTDQQADSTDIELFNKCTSLIDLDQSISSDGDDSSILCMEATEAKMKSISLYKIEKENLWAEDGEKLKVLSKLVPNSDLGDQNAEDDKTEKLCLTDDKQGVEDALPNFETEADHKNSLQEVGLGVETLKQEVGLPVGNTIETSKEPVSASDPVNMEETFEFDQGLVEPDVKEKPLCVGSVERSDSSLPYELKVAVMESGSNNDELTFVDTRCSALVNSDDVSSEACEAMMPESIVSGSVNLSRIHHSPESTH
ncbi:hypothetical protein Sango_2951700, partial [Sesamum angolense]